MITWFHRPFMAFLLLASVALTGCDDETGPATQMTSPPATSSSPTVPFITQSTGGFVSSLAYGNGLFVAVGLDGDIWTSADGVAWTPRNTGFDADLFGVIFADDLFVAVGGTDEGLARILISRDGVNWSSRVRGPAPTLLSITHETERRRFVAVGNNGAVMTSPDGISWSRRESGTTHHLTSVTNGNLTFRAVGENGVALVSNEGTHWFREEIEDFDVRLARRDLRQPRLRSRRRLRSVGRHEIRRWQVA